MAHPVVDQLRFTRSEWVRGLRGVSEEDANRHFGQMNSIGWIVGHLAWHEQRSFFQRPHDVVLFAHLNTEFASGAPMSTPPLKEMRAAWNRLTKGGGTVPRLAEDERPASRPVPRRQAVGSDAR